MNSFFHPEKKVSRSTLTPLGIKGMCFLMVALVIGGMQGVFADNNLVKFGNFESFSNPWGTGQYSSSGLWWVSRNALAEARPVSIQTPLDRVSTALYIENKSASGPHIYGTTSQRIPAKPNTYYRVSLWAKTQNLKNNGGVNIAYDSTWGVRPIHIKAGTNDWTYYAGVFTTGGANYIDLRIISEGIGKVWITGMQVHEVTDGIAHMQYSHPSGAVINAFVFNPGNLFIYKSSPGSPAAAYTDVSSGLNAAVLVNGTFIGGGPKQAFGDFVLNGGYDGYRGNAVQGGKNLLQMLNNRYHLAITEDPTNTFTGNLVGGRVSSTPPGTLRWAIGGLGGLLQGGNIVPFEVAGRHLYNNIGGDSSVARSAIGFTADKRMILVSIGQGSSRTPGASIQQLAEEIRWLGAQEAGCLDGGSATMAYYRHGKPSTFVASPGGSYANNWSFVGATSGRH